MPSLAGKVALVTGCGNAVGIGWATALRLAHDGADVAVHGRPNVEDATRELGQTIAGFGRRALRVTADLASEKDVVKMVDTVFSHFGRIDILVNNAALTGGFKSLASVRDADWLEVAAVNVRGTFFCIREAARIMAGQRSGVIINVVSGSRPEVVSGAAVYAATKSALRTLTEVVGEELRPKGIRLNAVAPASVNSPIGQALREQADKQGIASGAGRKGESTYTATPEDVASAVAFLASDDSGQVSGQILVVG